MKGFYQWYRKHITGAIFAGLILGILTGLFLADKFEVVLTATSALGSIYMNALNMIILFYRDGNCQYWKCKNNR